MAKRRGNKSAKIRALLEKDPNLSAKEVVKTLASQHVKVPAPLVYAIKAKQGGPSNGRKAPSNGYDVLIQAKKLADSLGGIDKAKAALDVLAKLDY